jgi:single-strand DNA-binding protein
MSVNKAIIVGRIGGDAEAIGTKGIRLNVATSERWKDKEGAQQERTEWHRITAWGTEAQVKYWTDAFKKGKNVYVEGQIRTEEYEKDGVKKYTTGIQVQGPASKLELLDPDARGEGSSNQSAPAKSTPANKPAAKPAEASKPAPQEQSQPQPDFDSFDDDIPF